MSYIEAYNIPLLQIRCNSVERTAVLSVLVVEDSDYSTNLEMGTAISTDPVPAFEDHPVIHWSTTYGGRMRLQFLFEPPSPHIVVPAHVRSTGLRVVSEGSNVFTIEFETPKEASHQCNFEIYAISSGGGRSTTRMKVILLPKQTPPARPPGAKPSRPHRPIKALRP